jgi:guanosine-diphosphatase
LILGVSIIVVCGMMYRFLVLGTDSYCSDRGTRYGIMFDAGSTGSRIHVFEFVFESNDIKLVREVFEQLKPGLSSYADNPEGAAKSLLPLLDVAMREVPVSQRACTPMLLKATAGLRLIGAEKSELILEEVRKLFAKYPFKVPPHGVQVMDGVDEGPFAWLTVNFLLGNFNAPSKVKTAGIMDLGGGSTQIVYEPHSEDVLAQAPAQYTRKITLFGKVYNLYQHSYLGYGLKEAGKRIRKVLSKLRGKTTEEGVPCFAPDHEETVEQRIMKGRKDSTFEQCLEHVNDALEKNAVCPLNPCSFQGVYQPQLTKTFQGDWYAFSYFYDLAETHIEEGKNDVLSVEIFRDLAKKACSTEHKGSRCLDMSFIYGLLSKGYELPDTTKLFLKKKINGVETAWALGAMISEM